jgi:AraC-like DNA-binding protein
VAQAHDHRDRLQLGLQQRHAFARVFRHRYDTTPRDFRNSQSSDGEILIAGPEL